MLAMISKTSGAASITRSEKMGSSRAKRRVIHLISFFVPFVYFFFFFTSLFYYSSRRCNKYFT